MPRSSRVLAASLCVALLVVASAPCARSLHNGLALTPPMGWSSWNTLRCDYTEKDLRDIADVIVSSGLQAAGYRFLNIDDCWEAAERTADGRLAADDSKFPNGLQAFGSYLHSLNLSFGLYTSSGPATCAGFPGSWQHEAVDAKTFASWGVDYLKLDCCYQFNVSDRARAFSAMSRGLLQSGRSILFSCDSDELILKENNHEWPQEWGSSLCNIARIHWDIWDSWLSTTDILTAAANIQRAVGPGYWNDLDMLTVGMGAQSADEYIAQFQLWCVLSSPLIIGADVRQLTAEMLRVLTNAEAVAINQDRLRTGGNLIRRSIDGSVEVYAKPLHDNATANAAHSSGEEEQRKRAAEAATTRLRHSHSRYAVSGLSRGAAASAVLPSPDFRPLPLHAVVLLNRASVAQNLTLDFTDLFDHMLCPHPDRPPFVAEVRDAWRGAMLGEFTSTFTAPDVRPHASVMLTVRLLN